MSIQAQRVAESEDVVNLAGNALEHFIVHTGLTRSKVKVTVIVTHEDGHRIPFSTAYVSEGIVDLGKFKDDYE